MAKEHQRPNPDELLARVQADKEQVTHTLHLAKELGGQSKQTAEPLTRCPECGSHVRRLI